MRRFARRIALDIRIARTAGNDTYGVVNHLRRRSWPPARLAARRNRYVGTLLPSVGMHFPILGGRYSLLGRPVAIDRSLEVSSAVGET